MQSGLLAGIQLVEAFTRSSIAFICLRNGSSLSSGSADGPSHFAWSGSGCASINRPAIPTAIPARASSLTCARRPPEAAPNGSRHCSAWVTSKMTGELLEAFFITPKPSISTTGCRNRSSRRGRRRDYFVVTPFDKLIDDVAHLTRADELRLLDVDHRPGLRHRFHGSVWRARKAGSWITSTTSAALAGFMNVGDDFHAKGLLQLWKIFIPSSRPGPR